MVSSQSLLPSPGGLSITLVEYSACLPLWTSLAPGSPSLFLSISISVPRNKFCLDSSWVLLSRVRSQAFSQPALRDSAIYQLHHELRTLYKVPALPDLSIVQAIHIPVSLSPSLSISLYLCRSALSCPHSEAAFYADQ